MNETKSHITCKVQDPEGVFELKHLEQEVTNFINTIKGKWKKKLLQLILGTVFLLCFALLIQ